MEDQSNPRVQAHAAAALINFTEDCPKSLLIPYLDSLVQHLHVIMVAKLQEVQMSLHTKFWKNKDTFLCLQTCHLVPANIPYSHCSVLCLPASSKGLLQGCLEC